MMQVDAREGLLASTPNMARSVGRPLGEKNNRPDVQGWHSEEESARRLGEDIQTRRRKRRQGIGPKAWIRHGRQVIYRDGCEEEYFAEELAKRTADAAPRRGRPRTRP